MDCQVGAGAIREENNLSSKEIRPRCLFCGSKKNKRSKEHVFRRAFKSRLPNAPSLAFTYVSEGQLSTKERPISQFDLVVNSICKNCNEGWLNDLENAASPIIRSLILNGSKCDLNLSDTEVLALWAFVRALLLTYISPGGRVPKGIFENVYSNRAVPRGCYVQVGYSTHLVFEAGSHQAFNIHPGDHYLGFIGFGLERLVFLVSISDSSAVASKFSLDTIRQPLLWFPGSFKWLCPPEPLQKPLIPMSGEQAQISCWSLGLRFGLSQPFDQLGNILPIAGVIPDRFHAALLQSVEMEKRPFD